MTIVLSKIETFFDIMYTTHHHKCLFPPDYHTFQQFIQQNYVILLLKMTIEKDIVNLPYNYPVRIHHLHETRRAVSLTHEIMPHANANDPRQISAIAIKGYPCTYT